MATIKSNSRPADSLRDGPIKATIWKNFGENGTFYTVEITRTYKDEGDKYQDSDSFRGPQLLQVAHLATRAYDRVGELRAADREELQPSAPPA